MLDILNVLLVDTCPKPYHENDGCDHPHNVIERVHIRYQFKFGCDEIEILQRQNYSIEQISTHEGRRIDHYSRQILLSYIHDTEPKNEPRLKTLTVDQVDGWEYSQLWIIVRLLWVKHSPACLYHHFPSLKVDQSCHDEQKVQSRHKKTHYEF